MVEPAVLTLQVSPRNSASDQIVRNLGSNPKSIMRLMNTEPVSKLSEYLVKKWKVEENNMSLFLYCRGSKMLSEDPLSAYMESSVSVKVALEFDLVAIQNCEETTTASSTPVASPVSTPTPDEIVLPEAVAVPMIPSERKRPATARKSAIQPTQQVVSLHEAAPASPAAADGRVEQIYREMLDREKEIFMSIIDSQARWLSQVQSQMVSTCLAVQEKALTLLVGSREDDECSSPRIEKRQKRQSSQS